VADIIRRNVSFARRIAHYIQDSPNLELLNPSPGFSIQSTSDTYPDSAERRVPIIPLNIVLFRGSYTSPYPPSDPTTSAKLTADINGTRKMYVTGTKWRGEGAVRLAVSNWRTGGAGEGEWEIVKGVFEEVMSRGGQTDEGNARGE
jgi:glutamate/tyrosine decarboxylase-like PLP-dependent enzyme